MPKSRIAREVDEILSAGAPSSARGRRKGRLAHTEQSPRDAEIERARDISERRIAALTANGENVRNTPAWRDALAERRMIDRMAPTGADVPLSIPRENAGSEASRVAIRWYAIPNENKTAGGFLPVIEENGRRRGDTWASRGYSKTDAETLAEEEAHNAAARYVGDWNVIVTKGRPTRQ